MAERLRAAERLRVAERLWVGERLRVAERVRMAERPVSVCLAEKGRPQMGAAERCMVAGAREVKAKKRRP
eukprot:141599-Chlamydomonas_euryale.AAC.2